VGKRELVKRPRNPRDFYGTVDPAAVEALAPFLDPLTTYVEPCAGDGSLIGLLTSVGHIKGAVGAYDIEPQAPGITQRNCLTLQDRDLYGVDCFITNPPFQWDMLKPILDHLPTLLPTWLLLPADAMHNKRTSPYMDLCSDVVSIGRLYWMKDRPIKGVDNNCWYRFDSKYKGFCKFHPRAL
jgi:hypothetical protein